MQRTLATLNVSILEAQDFRAKVMFQKTNITDYAKTYFAHSYDYSTWSDLYSSSLNVNFQEEANLCTLGFISPVSGKLEWARIKCNQNYKCKKILLKKLGV